MYSFIGGPRFALSRCLCFRAVCDSWITCCNLSVAWGRVISFFISCSKTILLIFSHGNEPEKFHLRWWLPCLHLWPILLSDKVQYMDDMIYECVNVFIRVGLGCDMLMFTSIIGYTILQHEVSLTWHPHWRLWLFFCRPDCHHCEVQCGGYSRFCWFVRGKWPNSFFKLHVSVGINAAFGCWFQVAPIDACHLILGDGTSLLARRQARIYIFLYHKLTLVFEFFKTYICTVVDDFTW